MKKIKTFTLLALISLASNLAANDAAPPHAAIEKALEDHQLEKAAQQLDTLQNDASAETHYLRGKLNFLQQQYAPAIDHLKKAISANDQVAKYYATIGTSRILLANQGNPMETFPMINEGMENYKHALTLDPHQVEAHIGLARFYTHAPPFAGGSLERAKTHADALMEKTPQLAWTEHALISQKAEDHEKAAQQFEKAIESAAQPNADLHYQAGQSYLKSNHKEKAKTAYQAALKIDPKHTPAKTALAQVLE